MTENNGPVAPPSIGLGAAPQPARPATPGLAPAPQPVAKPATGPVAAPAASAPGVSKASSAETNEQKIVLDDLLLYMLETGGSDLHISAGSPPVIRVRGEMQAIPDYGPMTPNMIQTTLTAIMNSKQSKKFEEEMELDFAYSIPGQARFRVNVLRQRGSMGAVMRTIPWEIKSLNDLNLPDSINKFADLPRGMVLVTGPTGSGKSTTLAAIVDRVNRTKRGHIMTIEDPVEFLHKHQGCIVNQREVGEDTHSFGHALKHVLRQDPDVILVGELRDLETISVALSAAETGHLVFATLHTQSAQETITRIIDVFPADQQQQVRTQLAATLQGVVCQTLCKTSDGNGRQAAVEIMVATSNIRALIRDDKLQQVQSALQAGSQYGMQTLNQHLADLVKQGRVNFDMAYEKCSDKKDLIDLLGGEAKAREYATRARAAKPASGLNAYTM